MRKVALVFPYFRTHSPTEMLFPPLGSALLKGQLAARGIQSRCFDCTFSSPGKVLESLRAWQPDVIGIYSMVSLSRPTFHIAQMARAELPRSILVAGGPLPTLHPERFVPAFDAVFKGEADVAFPSFCEELAATGVPRERLRELPLSDYEGLFMKGDRLPVDIPAAHYSEEQIASFPLPDRSDFDHVTYQEAWMRLDGTRTTSLMTTLGCPYGCDFCSKPIFGNTFRRRRLQAVFQEIDDIQRLGYDTLWIADDSFTLSPPHLEGFCQGMQGRALGWSCLSRVSGVSREMAVMMKDAGCTRVYLGLESASAETLAAMKKRATVEEGIEAVHTFRDAGIEVAAFLMVGYPGESVASIEKTLHLALALPLDYISFNVPYPLPGSPLFDRVSGVDPRRDWNAENEITFLYESELDERWLRQRIDVTMEEFKRARTSRKGPPGPPRRSWPSRRSATRQESRSR
jgi:anaerobic magnesium-protoporphyrin IX monomethyl ester cyclase